jgi:aspartyl-tRNA(Asn)/glutamyl-tRNA(Gln) amidotransferase subunit C
MSQGSIDIDYVANLARLELSAEEKARFAAQLGDILAYFEKINAVDVSGVEPMAHAFPVFNVLGDDVAEPGFTPAEALRNAPAVRDNQVLVPKVVDDA